MDAHTLSAATRAKGLIHFIAINCLFPMQVYALHKHDVSLCLYNLPFQHCNITRETSIIGYNPNHVTLACGYKSPQQSAAPALQHHEP